MLDFINFEMLNLYTLFILYLTCIFAYFLKGFSGFGPAPIFIPSVSIIWSTSLALSSSAVIDLLVGLSLLLSFSFNKDDIYKILEMSVFMAVGTFIGAYLLNVLSERVVIFSISVFVFAFGIYFLMGLDGSKDAFIKPRKALLRAGCLAGGFTGGLVGVSGPFVVVSARPLMDKSKFRRVLVAVFWLEGIFKISAYSTFGIWSENVITLALSASPAIVLGILLGYWTHFTVNERRFSLILGLILIAISLRTLLSVV